MPFNGARTAWDAAFEANEPVNTDTVSEGDDHLRQVKSFTRNRLETEHHFTLASSAADTGRHRSGSAVSFYQGTDPTDITIADVAGATALAAGDAGRLVARSDTGQFRVYTGSAWAEAVTALSGTAANRLNLLSGLQFFKAGIDPLDI